jgi:N-acetylglucosamine-6-phosphate deacetylase
MVKLWWRAKGAKRAILVTDAMSAAGMPDGEYFLGGFPVQVADGRAMAGGVLAGSVLTLDRALRKFIEYTSAPLEQALRLVTVNPASMLGLEDWTGPVAVGQPTNLVALDRAGRLIGSFVNSMKLGPFADFESAKVNR